MELERPVSRGGSHERPVTRWRREDRPVSRSGVIEDRPSDDRPISRRGIKQDSIMYQERPLTQRSSVPMRPPSASAFSGRTAIPGGTATRLTSAMMQSTPVPRTSVGLLSSQGTVGIMDRDRLVSQQGLSGVRTSTARGPSTRQVQDKRYFESLLQLKSRELTAEIARLRGQIDTDTRDHATFHVYDRRVKEMASQLTELQGSLSDYNLLVDKMNTGTERGEIMAEARDLAATNEVESSALESLFAERSRRQTQVAQLEQEIQKERQTAESLVSSMSPPMLEKYNTLHQTNIQLQQTMEQLQKQLDSLNSTKSSLEDQICVSSVKQEAVRLYQKLAELEERRDSLLTEEQNRATPAQERERLLTRVKEDNAEIASMERASGEMKEHIRQAQVTLEQKNQDLSESQTERHTKYLELRKREETMEAFLATWEANREAEAERLGLLEAEIVITLSSISRRLATLPTPADYLAIDQDIHIGQMSNNKTLESLTADHSQLTLYLNKVEVMEAKVKAELATLTDSLTRMQDEMIRLLDLEGLRSRAEERRAELTAERENLLETRATVMSALDRAREKQQHLEKQLSENETHTQLNNLERKLAQLEQNNFNVREFIATRTVESDFEPVRNTTLGLVKELNLTLRKSLKRPS